MYECDLPQLSFMVKVWKDHPQMFVMIAHHQRRFLFQQMGSATEIHKIQRSKECIDTSTTNILRLRIRDGHEESEE